MSRNLIGSASPRKDAWDKVCGSTQYIGDIALGGMWIGGTIRTPIARGRITGIIQDESFDWSRVVLITAADLPGPNEVAMIACDHPILAGERVSFPYEAVGLIAAPDQATLQAALAAVRVEIAEEAPILTLEESLRGDSVIWGEKNVISEYLIEDGDLEAGFAAADHVIEGIYRTGHQEHIYLEPNGMIATPRPGGGVTVFGSLQCPYYVHGALVHALGLPPEQVVVRQTPTGGAFGGKEDYPSVLGLHAALLSMKTERPIKMIYERSEDIRATTKRHPARVHHRTGVLRDGTLVAADIDVLLDGGAFTTMSPVVLSRAILHAAGPYRVPNVRIRGRAMATNTSPSGAFRGFGAPQTHFAVERQIDRIARELALDPIAVRRTNLLRDGDQLPFGQLLEQDVAAGLVFERALELSDYAAHRAQAGVEIEARDQGGNAVTVCRGLGAALFFHGGGFTGAGEERISGRVRIAYTREEGGALEIQVSNVEMGQGAATVLPMIVAEALDIPLEQVRFADPDTSRVPNSGPTVASRTTMVVGRILISACNDLIANIKVYLAESRGISADEIESSAGGFGSCGSLLECAREMHNARRAAMGEAVYESPPGLHWDEEAFRGDAYKAYSWGANVLEVEVDAATLEIHPIKMTVVVEIGRAINAVLATGQVEGGALQALGWGSLEQMTTEAGRFLNDRLTTYIIPTTLDTPAFAVEIAELPYEHGPFGAKGLGELPMNGGAPALAAAIENATGIAMDEIPITPEKLLAALMDEEGR